MFDCDKIFICSDANISATDDDACTPLMLAANEGHVEAFTALLERGAHIYDVDVNGKTVVHIASKKDHVNLLKVGV